MITIRIDNRPTLVIMYGYLKPEDDGLAVRRSHIWATVKLDYLSRYINVFETSMRKKWPIRNYIDLLAGPGKNLIMETEQTVLGSPLIALTTEHPFTGYYFVDANAHNVAALTERCSASMEREHTYIFAGDCNVMVNSIVTALQADEMRSLNLAFLDPEGLELQWTTVARLASIRKMDLIINYPEGGLNRYMRKAVSMNTTTSVDSFFGGREWRDIYLKYQRSSRTPLHRDLLDLYKGNLRGLGYQEVVRGDEIGDEPLMRNKKRGPQYRLIFASKHALGHDFWHAVTRRDVFGQKRLFDSY